jgi:hypothetical protein
MGEARPIWSRLLEELPMKFTSIAITAAAFAALTTPIYAADVPGAPTHMSYEIKGTITIGSATGGSGAGKITAHGIGSKGLTAFRKAGEACSQIMFTATTSDGVAHSTHAMGVASSGKCTYDLTFSSTPGLTISTAQFSSCGGTFADIAVDPAVIGLTNGHGEADVSEIP